MPCASICLGSQESKFTTDESIIVAANTDYTIMIPQYWIDCKFYDVHNFLWDRTRSVRQDFSPQHVKQSITVVIHETIARYRK
jgi:hypothetical protein